MKKAIYGTFLPCTVFRCYIICFWKKENADKCAASANYFVCVLHFKKQIMCEKCQNTKE